MDEHQRRVWARMFDALDAFDAEQIDLTRLCDELRGLFGAADVHDGRVRDEFLRYFSELDMVEELRTASWAPAGIETDERLLTALAAYRAWASRVMAMTNDQRS